MKSLINTITTQLTILRESAEPGLHRLTIDGFTMTYRDVHVDKAALSERLPLLIGLHGHGIHEGQMATLVGLELEQPFIYIALRGFHQLEDGSYSWFPFEIRGNEIISEEEVVMQTLERLAQFISEVVEIKHADPEQVYIVGYSMGSGLSQSLLLTYSELIAGAVAMAGRYFREIKPHIAEPVRLKGKPMFIGHGLKDPLISAVEMQDIVTTYADLGLDVTYRTYQIPHVVSQAERRDVQQWLAGQLQMYTMLSR